MVHYVVTDDEEGKKRSGDKEEERRNDRSCRCKDQLEEHSRDDR